MSGKAPYNYKRRSVGIPHNSKSLTPNVACPGSSLKQLVFARERMKCYPRSSFSDSSRWHFPNKRTKWAQGAYSVILQLQHSCTFIWEKSVRESSPFAVWNCSLNVCVLSFLWCSPLPRGQSEQLGRPGYESLKEGPVFAHYDCTFMHLME